MLNKIKMSKFIKTEISECDHVTNKIIPLVLRYQPHCIIQSSVKHMLSNITAAIIF